MAADMDRDGDLARLNGFVDGELSPSERVAVAARLASNPEFARAHATLARLKACLQTRVDDEKASVRPVPLRRQTARPRRPWRPMVRARTGWAALAAAGCVAVVTLGVLAPQRSAPPVPEPASTVVLASLPGQAMLPRLEGGGLRLTAVSVSGPDGRRTVVATYLGPRGCKLELRVGPAGIDRPAGPGSSRRAWEVGGVAYELVAYGMPARRFAYLADAAELETRRSHVPERAEQRLREARRAAPPCTG